MFTRNTPPRRKLTAQELFLGFDAEKFNALNMEIEAKHNEAEDLKKRSEQCYRERDNMLEPMEEQASPN